MEQELKLALDPADLPRLLEGLPAPERVVEQTNHYFVDPEGRAARARVMVRVREERDAGSGELRRVVLTLKRRTAVEGGVFRAEEREAELDPADWLAVREGERDLADAEAPPLRWLRSETGVTALLRQGGFVNERRLVRHVGFDLEIDRTSFPGGVVEAEVEVETDRPAEARAVVEGVARRQGVRLRDQTRGKYARYLAHLRS
ncbi:MAG: CYTH domain-containing protein [Myxococcota bacterium]